MYLKKGGDEQRAQYAPMKSLKKEKVVKVTNKTIILVYLGVFMLTLTMESSPTSSMHIR